MKREPPRAPGIWSGAHKWFTGIVTTIAAVMTLLLNAKNLGLSSWLGILEPNLADHAARRIVLTPRSDTLRALGDTAAVVATVTDARGATLAGATLRWRSSDSTVATVDSGGTIVARAPGRATIEARVREVTASAAVLVRQLPVTIEIPGDSVRRLADGDTLRLAARVLDARGHAIRGAEPGWESTDPRLVSVDSLGVLVARGPGRTQVSATAGALRASLDVDVRLTPSALIVVSGAAQRAIAGRALVEPLVLQVLSRGGLPVAGVPVLLQAEDADASTSPTTLVSDDRGRVRAQWTLGARAGEQRLVARVPSLDSALTLTAAADPTARNLRVELQTPEPRATVGTTVDRPVAIRVTDTLGVALAGVRVAWTALDGGAVSGATLTDSVGTAEARWTFGPKAGGQRLRAQVGDARHVPATTVRGVAEPGAAHRVVMSAARVGSAGTRRVTIRVVDAHGNPVPAVPLRVTASTGTLDVAAAATDSLGVARVLWKPAVSAAAKRAVPQIAVSVPGTKTASALRLP